MKATVVLELEIADVGTKAALDVWVWALERQIEEMHVVAKARVADAWLEPRLWDDEPPQDKLRVRT